MLGLAPAASAATANPPFCKGVKSCTFGGDAGQTWVNAPASSAAKGRAIAARLLSNAKAVHRGYGAPRWINIHVIKKGSCRRTYGHRPPSRACAYEHVLKKLS
ncbi:hypothetical protein ABGB18_18930 [Nonomuraea sp. B12E4]|uniref:hypothetical protein n=1 Tax=Nonomuraea sp. B12E4 TaxID=3153564 RepID=UPI00325EFC80